MKPSERIGQIVREMAKKEAESKNPGGWETVEDLTSFIVRTRGEEFLLMAILKYLDEVALNEK
jgi:hypothetical protein